MLKKAFYSRPELENFLHANESEGPQLPQGKLRMMDRVVSISETEGRYQRGALVAEYDLDPQQWFFSCHFPGDPVMPGCLVLDGLWQCLGFYLAWRGYHGKGRAIGVDTVRFFNEILPQSGSVQYRLHVRRILTRDFTLGVADGEVWVGEQQVYRAENLKVALFRQDAVVPSPRPLLECV